MIQGGRMLGDRLAVRDNESLDGFIRRHMRTLYSMSLEMNNDFEICLQKNCMRRPLLIVHASAVKARVVLTGEGAGVLEYLGRWPVHIRHRPQHFVREAFLPVEAY